MIGLRDMQQWLAHGQEWLAEEVETAARLVVPLQGSCPLCLKITTFVGTPQGDIRERLACGACGATARQRAVASVLFKACPDTRAARVYATEQASTFYLALHGRIGKLQGGEFGVGFIRRLRLQLWMLRKGLFERLAMRDLTHLDFPVGSLDAVVSLDVLEHVPDYRQALREVVRVLRPGGVFVFTVPFYVDRAESKQVAWLDEEGCPVFEGEPEYHGDPVSGGVLCFHHFAWDFLAIMREEGFADAQVLRVYSPGEGLPTGQWVIQGRR